MNKEDSNLVYSTEEKHKCSKCNKIFEDGWILINKYTLGEPFCIYCYEDFIEDILYNDTTDIEEFIK